jgi:hypothetical protein
MFAGHTIGSIAVTAVLAVGIPSLGADPSPRLSVEDRCVISAALESGDPRRMRIAHEVLRGEAGVLALADPWILHHHRVDTTRPCR